jgi:hypothetical protein
MSVAVGASTSIRQLVEASFLIAIENLVTGLPSNSKFLARFRHRYQECGVQGLTDAVPCARRRTRPRRSTSPQRSSTAWMVLFAGMGMPENRRSWGARKIRERLPMSPSWTIEEWWARQDLNLGPTDYESAALTAELQARNRVNIGDLRYLKFLSTP